MKKILLAPLFLVAIMSFQLFGDWPQFQKDCKHTGSECDISINLPLCIKQMFQITREPVAAGIGLIDASGCMYFNEYNRVRKLDLKTGQFLWNTPTDVELINAPGMIYNNTVIFEFYNGFACYDMSSGILLWEKTVSGMSGNFTAHAPEYGSYSFPTQAGGKIYCGTSNGEIAVVNASDGTTAHVFKVSAFAITAAPAIDDDGTIYVGAFDGNFLSINGSTGGLKWEYSAAMAVVSSATLDNSGVYCSNSGGKVFKLNKSNGSLLWSNRCQSFNYGSGAVYGDGYYIGSDDRNVYCFNKETGAINWSTRLADNFANMSCIVVCDKVFIAGCINQLVILDSSTGSQDFSCLTLSSNFSNLSYWNKNIIFSSLDGYLYIVGECDPSCGVCSCDSSKQTPTMTWTVSQTFSSTPTITNTPTITQTLTFSPTLTITQTSTPSVTSTITPSVTETATPTFTLTQTYTFTQTCTATITPTFSPTFTITATFTATATITATSTVTQTFTVTKTPLPCNGLSAPAFTVVVNYGASSRSDLEIDISSSSQLPSPPSVTVCFPGGLSASENMRAQCHSQSCLTFTASAADAVGKTFLLLYPKSSPGDFDSITVSGADFCGISGKSDGTFTSKTAGKCNVSVMKNVINPDNGEKTTLQCKMSNCGGITAKVYSRTGQLVKTICSNEAKQKGECAISWDGTCDSGAKAASGVYAVVIETADYNDIEKVCVVR